MTGVVVGDVLARERTDDVERGGCRHLPDVQVGARHFGQRAIDAIAGFPNGKAKAALIETVEFAIARGY